MRGPVVDREQFVFRDPQGRRWQQVRRWTVFAWVLVAASVIVFVRALFVDPHLEALPKTPAQAVALAPSVPSAVVHRPPLPAPWLASSPGHSRGDTPGRKGLVRVGFLDDDADRALESLQAHGSALTHIAPVWLHLTGMPPRLTVTRDETVARLAAEKHLGLMPLLTNEVNDSFEPEAVEHYLRAGAADQRAFADKLKGRLEDLGAQGVILAWEQVDPAYHADLTAFVALMHDVLQAAHLELWLSVPVGDEIKVFDLDDLAPHVDRFVAMLYYETGEDDGAGPVASLSWFRQWLEVLADHGAPAQWVAGIGTFGYDWPAEGKAQLISFNDAMARAASAGIPTIDNSAPHDGATFAYQLDGVDHNVWFLDAISFRNQLRLVLERKLGGVAVDRVGTEDPLIWNALRCGSACVPAPFEDVPMAESIATVGEGDFPRVRQEQRHGRRAIAVDPEGNWASTYRQLPATLTVVAHGDTTPDRVALTFDDGPDPSWTPGVLDILRSEGVTATFFVTGENANTYPNLARRIVAEGHTLGNHSFSHPDLAQSSPVRIEFELNATQRAIEHITGRSTLLFRPPYDADRTPHKAEEAKALLVAERLGYTSAMASIDPLDWEEPTAAEILERVRVQRPEGNVLLLHDGGGDRSQTLAALPALIRYLKARGDEIVPLHSLLGVDRDAVMPKIPPHDPAVERVLAGTGLGTMAALGELGRAFLVVTTVLLLLRTLFVAGLAVHRARRERRILGPSAPYAPAVSAVVAAYNEERGIAQTLGALLASRYPGELEVIVMDDGSSDRTVEVVAAVAASDPRVRLLRQVNTGKPRALQAALRAARHGFIVMLDADTQFGPDTVAELVRPLQDPDVGAVSGHIEVANASGLLGRFQALEYISGFNLDRRAYDALDALIVVPGAASAYRAEAITAAGGIQSDTLAEDTDLTLALHRAGYRIRHTPLARAYTEAPATLAGLLRQRKRWAFGTMQCLWKHKTLTLDPAHRWLGMFAIPNVWLFQIGLVALVPLVDGAALVSLLRGDVGRLLVYSALFLAADLALATVACRLEGVPLRRSLLVVPMRILYRPILSLAVISSLVRALRGRWVGWGLQERWGIARRRMEGRGT